MQATMHTADAEKARRRRSIFDNDRLLGSILLAPAVLYIALLVGVPFVLAIAFSFTDVTTGNPTLTFVGLDTFSHVVRDINFQRALFNTLLFTAISQVVVMILVNIWRLLPMSTVIIMAGLTSIPPEIRDAATVDGANFLQEFWYVTVPLLRPITAVAFLFGVVFTFTDMAVVRVLTTGNNDTHVLASWAFFKGIEGGSLSEGAATAVFLLPVLIGVAVIMLRIARRAEVT